MSFFLFLIVLVLLVVLLTRKKPGVSDDYQRGYWDGYRALGDKVQRQLEQPDVNRTELQSAVAIGYGAQPQGVVNGSMTSQEVLLYDEPPQAPMPGLTPEARSLRNLNTILYMASFLLVAAGALFVSAAMPNAVKLVGVWLIIILFYGVGYGLHSKVARLRPASLAFLGTGLALIPFAGFALQAYTTMGSQAAWLMTSIVGVVAYFVAAIRLQNQFVSYLAVAFILSLVAASSASVSLALVWQFVVFIGVSLVANSLALVRPTWVPAIFREPIERTGQLVTPFVLVASAFVGHQLQLRGYELIFTTATFYYIVVWLQTKQLAYETILRVILPISMLMYAYDWSHGNLTVMGLGLLGVATIQIVYSLARVAASEHASIERTWLVAAFSLHVLSFGLWQQNSHASLLNVAALFLLGVSSLVTAIRLRSVTFGSIGVIVSYILPFVIARSLVQPVHDWWVLAVWFTVATSLTIGLLVYWQRRSRALRALLGIGYMGYVVLAILAAALQASHGFLTTFLLIHTVIVAAASYLTRQPKVMIAAAIILPLAVGNAWQWLALDPFWALLGTAWITASLYYFGYAVSQSDRERERRTIFLVATWVILGLGVLCSFLSSTMASVGALTVVVLAATVIAEGYIRQHRELTEIGVYIATLGLQRALNLAMPDLTVVLYGHWWALTIAAMTLLYAERTQTRLIIGLAFMSASSAIYALGEGGGYQLLFLVEHIALLLYGALRSVNWALWWGLAGSALAVVYLLGGFTFGSLGFLGLLMIGIVVWRLLRVNQHSHLSD